MSSLGDEVRTLVASAAEQHGFAGAVRVAVERRPVVETAFGMADRERGTANSCDTRFALASGSKLFTALGVLRLIERGTLSFDARLLDIVSTSLPKISREVTIRNLLTHTSGVYDYYDEELVDDFDAFELPISPTELLEPRDYLPMMVDGEMKFRPGERFSYSNGGYVLLGIAIEECSGQRYHDYITEEVFRTCGMVDSGFFRLDDLPPRVARGYVEVPQSAPGWTTNVDKLPVIGGPDGGAYSTVADMERLWFALLDNRLLTPSITEVALTRTVHWKAETYYGHGLWIHHDGVSPSRIYVEGCDAGVSFRSSCYAEGTVATVASNTTEGAWAVCASIDDLIRDHLPELRWQRELGGIVG